MTYFSSTPGLPFRFVDLCSALEPNEPHLSCWWAWSKHRIFAAALWIAAMTWYLGTHRGIIEVAFVGFATIWGDKRVELHGDFLKWYWLLRTSVIYLQTGTQHQFSWVKENRLKSLELLSLHKCGQQFFILHNKSNKCSVGCEVDPVPQRILNH